MLAACASGPEAAAQTTPRQGAPLRGMVWQVPPDAEQAQDDLLQMHRLGVEAVRTSLLDDENLLVLADTLGLHLFQELPLDGLPAAALYDTLAFALRALEAALQRAQGHPSARHFGLARRSDTSDPHACRFFEQLARSVHQLPGGQAYYLGPFIEDDRCAAAVDFVLLDAREAPNPAGLLLRWRAAPAVPARRPAGIGALGAWVSARAVPGLRDPRSAESQARYLEKHLRALLYDAAQAPPAVFVHRWRDVRTPTPSPAYDLARPYEQGYGLHTADDVPRPALDVVRGFFTGQQTVFAFPAGEAPAQEVPWPVLIGWLALVLVAACYALSPRFRFMVVRYFQAHGFYREAIREGRDVLLGASVVLLVTLALSVGVLGSALLEAARREPVFQRFFEALPGPVQVVGVALLAQPWMLVLLISSVYALGVALWTSLLSLASRRRQPLVPGQVLMLVLWVRWSFLPLMAGAMVVPSLPAALPVALALVACWMLLTLYAIVRTLVDYAAITYVPAYQVALIGLLNPVVLLGVAAFALALNRAPMLAFLWHLATRS